MTVGGPANTALAPYHFHMESDDEASEVDAAEVLAGVEVVAPPSR